MDKGPLDSNKLSRVSKEISSARRHLDELEKKEAELEKTGRADAEKLRGFTNSSSSHIDKKSDEPVFTSRSDKSALRFLRNRLFLFWVAIASGASAIISGLLYLYSGWWTLGLTPASLTSLEQTINSTYATNATLAQELLVLVSQGYTAGITIRDGLFVLVPLLVIAGAFMILSAFYLKSRSKEMSFTGSVFCTIFSVVVILGLMVYFLISPLTISELFGYIGAFGLQNSSLSSSLTQTGGTYNSSEFIEAFSLWLAYMLLGLLAAIAGFYRAYKSRSWE